MTASGLGISLPHDHQITVQLSQIRQMMEPGQDRQSTRPGQDRQTRQPVLGSNELLLFLETKPGDGLRRFASPPLLHFQLAPTPITTAGLTELSQRATQWVHRVP
jgi:hypothetical protein